MSKPLSLIERLKAIRRHPRLLAKGLYITAMVGLIGGTAGEVFSTKNWVETGRGESPLLIAWMAGIVAAGFAIWKDLFKTSLPDSGEIIEIGITKEKIAEPWKLSSSRIVFLCVAASVYVGVSLLAGGALSSFMGNSTRSVIRRNAVAACRIATDVHLGRVTDTAGTLKEISAARENLTKLIPSISSENGITDDKLILFGALGMLDRSEQTLANGIDVRNDPSADAFFRQVLPACETLDAYH